MIAAAVLAVFGPLAILLGALLVARAIDRHRHEVRAIAEEAADKRRRDAQYERNLAAKWVG